mmetsp:Transcript_168299/g.540702  ORF Transcript_168299/g.540702 Transcript_168299/m.540702 type:complete len:95 (+) Transcript_168299:199-483(+)
MQPVFDLADNAQQKGDRRELIRKGKMRDNRRRQHAVDQKERERDPRRGGGPLTHGKKDGENKSGQTKAGHSRVKASTGQALLVAAFRFNALDSD